MKKKCRFREGFVCPLKPQVVGAELEKIERTNDGRLLASDVLEAARNPKNPLNLCFEWDDTKAAEQYRIKQAQALIGSLVVEIIGEKAGQPIRKYVSVRDDGGRHYSDIDRAMSTKGMREQVLASAVQQVEIWSLKYRQYQELAAIHSAVEKTKRKLSV